MKAETSGKDEAASDIKKRKTREEKKAARIKAKEKKRMRMEESRNAKTRRSKEGTWTRKNSATHFGNKLHTVQRTDLPLIKEFVVTTASLHDSQVDLSTPGIPCYKDGGYSGCYCKDTNAIMDRASRNNPLTVEQIRRNLRITGRSYPWDRKYSVMKRIMNGDHTFVTMVRRYGESG